MNNLLSDYKLNYEIKSTNIQNIDNYISTVVYIDTDINHITFDNGISSFDNYNTIYTNSDKTIDELFKDKIEGIRYYDDKKILIIPTKLDDYLDLNKNNNYEAIIGFYNLNKNNKWKFKINNILPHIFPIYKKIVLTSIEKLYKADIDNNIFILYDNLPKSLFNNVIIEEQGIIYNIETNEYFTKSLSQEKLFNRIKNIAENGFKQPLKMLICSDGLLPIDESRVDFIISLYLNLSHIPVSFIVSNELLQQYTINPYDKNSETNMQPHHIKKYNNKFIKEELINFFTPYFNFD